jgi:hypothetical protein
LPWLYEKSFEPVQVNKRERIEEERKKNMKIYKNLKEMIYERYRGKYVVIAEGRIQAVGASLEDMKAVAMGANHRFVFRVEPREKERGILRWPMRKR